MILNYFQLRRWDWYNCVCLLLVLCVTFWIYSDALQHCFAFADDYEKVFRASNPAYDLYLADGRYVYAAFLPVFSLADTVCGLWKVRAIALVGVALLGGFHFIAARVSGWGRGWACAFALSSICTIPQLLFVGWASLYIFPFAASSALCASVILGRDGSWRWGVVIFAVSLLWIATSTYQPSIGFYWLGVALILLQEGKSFAWRFKRFTQYGLLFVGTLSAYYVVYRFGFEVFQVSPSQRGATLVGNFTERLVAVVNTALLDSLSIFSLQAQPALAICVLLVVVSGIMLRARRERVSAFSIFALFVALLMLSYVPSLVAGVASFGFRTQAAVHSLVLLWLFAAFREVALRVPKLRRRGVGVLCIAGLIVVVGSYTRGVFVDSMVSPLVIERELLLRHVQEQLSHCPSKVHVVRPGYEDALGVLRYDEFGSPSVVQDWGVEVVLPVVMREVLPECAEAEFSSSWGIPRHSVGAELLHLQSVYQNSTSIE